MRMPWKGRTSLLQLSNEMLLVQQQVQKVSDEVALLHTNFNQFGAHLWDELRNNAKNHVDLLSKLQGLTKEEEAAKAAALEQIQT